MVKDRSDRLIECLRILDSEHDGDDDVDDHGDHACHEPSRNGRNLHLD